MLFSPIFMWKSVLKDIVHTVMDDITEKNVQDGISPKNIKKKQNQRPRTSNSNNETKQQSTSSVSKEVTVTTITKVIKTVHVNNSADKKTSAPSSSNTEGNRTQNRPYKKQHNNETKGNNGQMNKSQNNPQKSGESPKKQNTKVHYDNKQAPPKDNKKNNFCKEKNNFTKVAKQTGIVNKSNEQRKQRPPKFHSVKVPIIAEPVESNINQSNAGKTWMYVGRMKAGTADFEVTNYLMLKFPLRHFEVEQLPRWKDAQTESFKVLVDNDILDEFQDTNNWHNNVKVTKFMFFKK